MSRICLEPTPFQARGFVAKFVDYCIRHRVWVVALLVLATLGFALAASSIQVKTVFNDLLPLHHPYVKIHEKYKKTFGGSNQVNVMLSVRHGDIFTPKILGKIRYVTRALEKVDAVDPFQIVSLAAKKLRAVHASTDSIDIDPLMWPDVPETAAGIQKLRQEVMKNPLVLGHYVSTDLKSALISVDFYDSRLDYKRAFRQIEAIVGHVEGDGLTAHVVGEPILYGWVTHYLPQTGTIFLVTLLALAALLFLATRTLRGTLLPLLAGLVSAIWALGTASLLGFNLDPLVIVVAFLITARAISHSVQLVLHFDDEIESGTPDAEAAARAAMRALFKPGILGVVADAGCMVVVLLTPIPLLQKVSVIGAVWVITIAISACVLTPVLLSWVGQAGRYAHPLSLQPAMRRVLGACASIPTGNGRFVTVGIAAAIFVISGIYAFTLQVGDANPGSPILWPGSRYNQDAAAINARFPGADRMFVVVSGSKTDALKSPGALRTITELETFLDGQPAVGGTLSLADLIPPMNRILHEGNPRYEELGGTASENGEILYLLTSNTDPGDMSRYVDPLYRNAAVNIYFRDHRGETIRTAIALINTFINQHPNMPVTVHLAGGLIGVLAAVNEIILSKLIESIALALLVLILCCAVAYRSLAAGLFFMVPVVLSNTITFSFMAWNGIGMNINTLPIAALGIGLGVDYSFYVIDEIREYLRLGMSVDEAIKGSLLGAGRGVLITAATLITSVLFWYASSLRFQADMGVLMALWLFVSASSSLLLMPSLAVLLKPRFIFSVCPPAISGASSRRALEQCQPS